MDKDQQKCVEIAENGHNLLITGQAGTGKTYTAKNLVKALRQQGKNCSFNLLHWHRLFTI
jgi:Cdc6-like AAA superfamily ATPase